MLALSVVLWLLVFFVKLLSGSFVPPTFPVSLKAVLDNLNFVLDMELQEGRIVKFGDFGSFRISVSSDWVTDKKDFNTSMLRPPRIIFTPGGELKDTKKTLEYARVSQDGATTEAGGSDSDSPDEI